MILGDGGGFRATLPLVVLVVGKRTNVFACLLVNEETLFFVDAYQFVSPPCIPFVLWLHVAVVGAAEVQIFQGEEFFFLTAHGQCCAK